MYDCWSTPLHQYVPVGVPVCRNPSWSSRSSVRSGMRCRVAIEGHTLAGIIKAGDLEERSISWSTYLSLSDRFLVQKSLGIGPDFQISAVLPAAAAA